MRKVELIVSFDIVLRKGSMDVFWRFKVDVTKSKWGVMTAFIYSSVGLGDKKCLTDVMDVTSRLLERLFGQFGRNLVPEGTFSQYSYNLHQVQYFTNASQNKSMAILSLWGHIKEGEGQTVVSKSTSQPHDDAGSIYSHCVDAHFSNVKVEIVALMQPRPKIGSKKVCIRYQVLWAASSTNCCWKWRSSTKIERLFKARVNNKTSPVHC
jgi:hypothetical protein